MPTQFLERNDKWAGKKGDTLSDYSKSRVRENSLSDSTLDLGRRCPNSSPLAATSFLPSPRGSQPQLHTPRDCDY